jgi:hypothetical protein
LIEKVPNQDRGNPLYKPFYYAAFREKKMDARVIGSPHFTQKNNKIKRIPSVPHKKLT